MLRLQPDIHISATLRSHFGGTIKSLKNISPLNLPKLFHADSEIEGKVTTNRYFA